MAIDGKNLAGAFPVFDTSKSVGTYSANLQRQAAQRAAEKKALQDDMEKIKIDGLRDADKDDYFKGFEDWRSTAQSAYKERDYRRKSELQSLADRKYLELNSLVNKSKEYGKLHQDISNKLLDDKFRDQFTDDAVTVWQKSGNLPLSSAEIVKDPTILGRQMDLSGIQKKVADLDDDLIKKARYSNPVTRRITSGNKTGTESIYTRSVKPEEQALAYGMLYDTERDVRNFVRQQYAEQFDKMGEDEAKAFAIQDMVKKAPIIKQDAPKIDWDRAPDKFYEHYDYRRANPMPSTSAPVIPEKSEELTIPFADGKGQVRARAYVKVPMPSKNFAGSNAIDLYTGKPIKLTESSNNYTVVGVDNFPFVKSGKGTKTGEDVSGALAQPRFEDRNPNAVEYKPMIHVKLKKGDIEEDFLVPYDRMPQNLTKANRAALNNFVPAVGGKLPGQAKPSAKAPESKATGMVTMILPNGQSGQVPADKVEAFLKKYPKAKKQ